MPLGDRLAYANSINIDTRMNVVVINFDHNCTVNRSQKLCKKRSIDQNSSFFKISHFLILVYELIISIFEFNLKSG